MFYMEIIRGSYRALDSLNVLLFLYFKACKVLGYGKRAWKSLENDNMTNQFDLMCISIYQCAE